MYFLLMWIDVVLLCYWEWMCNNGDMMDLVFVLCNVFVGVFVVWVMVFVVMVVIGIFVFEEWCVFWLLVGFGGVVLLLFVV